MFTGELKLVWEPDTRPQGDPKDPVTVARLRYLNVARTCLDNYLAGATTYPVEAHPQAKAAMADWIAIDRRSSVKSTYV